MKSQVGNAFRETGRFKTICVPAAKKEGDHPQPLWNQDLAGSLNKTGGHSRDRLAHAKCPHDYGSIRLLLPILMHNFHFIYHGNVNYTRKEPREEHVLMNWARFPLAIQIRQSQTPGWQMCPVIAGPIRTAGHKVHMNGEEEENAKSLTREQTALQSNQALCFL